MTEYLQRLKALGRNAHMYLIASFTVGFSVVPGIAAVLMNLYLVRLGYGPEFIGTINGIGSLAFALASLPGGGLGARWGSRRTMVRGLAGVALGYALLPTAELLGDPLRSSYLIVLRIFTSATMSIYFVNTRPLVMGMVGPDLRAYLFSMQGTVAPLGAFLGNLVAGWFPSLFAALGATSLAAAMPYRWPLALCSLFLLPAIFSVAQIDEEGQVDIDSKSSASAPVGGERRLPWQAIGGLMLVSLLQGGSVAVTRAFLNVYMDTTLALPTSFIGGMASLGQLGGMLCAFGAPLLVKHIGNRGTYLVGVFGVVSNTLLISLLPTTWATGLGCVGINAMIALTIPAMNMYQMNLVSSRWRPLMSGATTMAMGVSFAVVSLSGGYLAASMGYRQVFLLGSGCGVGAALVFWLLGVLQKRRRVAASCCVTSDSL